MQTERGSSLCSSKHPSRDDFYPFVSRQLGLAAPTFVAEPQRSAGKVIDGSKICHELGFEYSYDDPMKMPLE